MRTAPIAPILDAQDPAGWWAKPGHGYGPKYTGTTWSLIVLEQLGADPADARIQAGCDYVLAHTATAAGGFGCSGALREDRPPPPSSVIHCLNGNLVRALVAFGRLDDPRVAAAIDWQARAINRRRGRPALVRLGDAAARGSAAGPTRGCRAPGARSRRCAAFAAIPPERRSPAV